MFYKGDIGLYLSGSPVPIPECAIFITQPTIQQIEQFGELKFLMGAQLLGCTDKFFEDIKEGNSELSALSDFQILMTMVKQESEIKTYLTAFFALVCPDFIVKYNNQSLDFYMMEEDNGSMRESLKGQVTPFTFPALQRVVKELFVIEGQESDDYNPMDEKAKAIAEKLRKGRQKVQELNPGKSNETSSLYGSYASILAVGLPMDINTLFNYTPFQIVDTFNRYWEKVKFDQYTQITMTPFMDTSKIEQPDQWTRNLYPKDHSNM